ncbi:helix-turn-helix transcriptional regulator [Bacillaceae bacterium W0354]
MNEIELRMILSPKIKIIRAEYDYTQDEMANMLGVSKKTLVQIEKGRTMASWPVVVTFATLFRDSQILQQELGNEDIIQLIQTISRKTVVYKKEKTLGGKIWWTKVDEKNGFILQKNMISNHFRIIDQFNVRYFSSFDRDETNKFFNHLQHIKDDGI